MYMKFRILNGQPHYGGNRFDGVLSSGFYVVLSKATRTQLDSHEQAQNATSIQRYVCLQICVHVALPESRPELGVRDLTPGENNKYRLDETTKPVRRVLAPR